ncbi:MAG: hypothetical protein M3071_11000 [Actinomycetota bacterium]|nr:hypothetical protein [Actinomycetota bacterium]
MFTTVASVAPAAIITIAAVVLIVAAIVVFLLAIILELKTISNGLDVVIPPVTELVQKTAPVNQLVSKIVGDLGAGTDLLEGLLIKKAGVEDSAGLIESLFPGGGQAFLARQGRPGKPRHFGVVYSRGALQLARLGRGAPLGAPMRGAALRDPLYASASPRSLFPDPRGEGNRPKSPVVGANSPVQYSPSGDVSMPSTQVTEPAPPVRWPPPTSQPATLPTPPTPSQPSRPAFGGEDDVIRYRRGGPSEDAPMPSTQVAEPAAPVGSPAPTSQPATPPTPPSQPSRPAFGGEDDVIRYRR